jgi:hypothetical protein
LIAKGLNKDEIEDLLALSQELLEELEEVVEIERTVFHPLSSQRDRC